LLDSGKFTVFFLRDIAKFTYLNDFQVIILKAQVIFNITLCTKQKLALVKPNVGFKLIADIGDLKAKGRFDTIADIGGDIL